MPPKSQLDSLSRKANIQLDACVKRLTKHLEDAEDYSLWAMPRKKLPKLGRISQKVYTSGSIINQQYGLCGKLPNEVLFMVLLYLPRYSDWTSFALTCKQNSRLVEAFKVKHPFPKRPTRMQRLEVLVQLQARKLENAWMPAQYRLCYSCLVYRPKQKEGKAGSTWGGNSSIAEQKLTGKKAVLEGPRCPGCVRRAFVELHHDMGKAKELHKLCGKARRAL